MRRMWLNKHENYELVMTALRDTFVRTRGYSSIVMLQVKLTVSNKRKQYD